PNVFMDFAKIVFCCPAVGLSVKNRMKRRGGPIGSILPSMIVCTTTPLRPLCWLARSLKDLRSIGQFWGSLVFLKKISRSSRSFSQKAYKTGLPFSSTNGMRNGALTGTFWRTLRLISISWVDQVFPLPVNLIRTLNGSLDLGPAIKAI